MCLKIGPLDSYDARMCRKRTGPLDSLLLDYVMASRLQSDK